jgi:hypothetical protein
MLTEAVIDKLKVQPEIWLENLGKTIGVLQRISQCGPRKVKVKVKFTLKQATKAQRGSRGIAVQPRRLMGVGSQSHAPAALPPKRNPVPIV